MTEKRKDDTKAYTQFRSNRFFQEQFKWYFVTREGTTEGPFERKIDAENRLEDYIKVMVSDLLPDTPFSLKPQ